MEQIRIAVEEAKSMIWKVQENIVYYYNQRRTPAFMFSSRNKVFLDTLDIKTTYPSAKLSYWRLRPFIVEWQMKSIAYQLKLFLAMKKLHPVFNVMKLSATLTNLILRQRPNSPPPPIII